MTLESAPQQVNIVLSRDELLFLLQAVKADFILGLDSEPMGDRSPEQQEIALTVAGRALQARGLVSKLDSGEIIVHNNLLEAIGTCAYPQQTLSIYHWPADSESTTRYFAHLRAGTVVAHLRPQDVLHLISKLPSKEYLIEQVLNLCKCSENLLDKDIHLSLRNADLTTVRTLAEEGKTQAAIDLLAQQGIQPETSTPFVEALTHRPHISIVQILKQQQNNTLARNECTIIQNERYSWLLLPQNENSSTLSVQSTNKVDLREKLLTWIS